MDRNVDKKERTPEVSDGARTLENWVRGHAHYSEDMMAVRTTRPGSDPNQGGFVSVGLGTEHRGLPSASSYSASPRLTAKVMNK